MTAIQITGLKKKYGNQFEALKGIDLTVPKGSFYGLLGPNGAGKSTIIGIICNLVNKDSGDIHVLGKNMEHESTACRAEIGVVPQEFNFNIFEPCLQIICNHAGYYGVPSHLAKERAFVYLKKLGLWEKRFAPAGRLSGGLKRRLMIVRALIHQPKILILDEPTAGVDIALRHVMWEFLQELNQQGITIILTTHYLEEAEKLCDEIAIIDKGEVLKVGPKEDLINSLKRESIELYCDGINGIPKIPNVNLIQLNEHKLELNFGEDQSLTDILAQLHQKGICVKRIKNKVNRLEELFLDVVDTDHV